MNKLKKIFLTAVATLTVSRPPAKNPQPKVTGTTDTRSCKKTTSNCLSEPSAPKGGCTTN